jgi:hypothetical protein
MLINQHTVDVSKLTRFQLQDGIQHELLSSGDVDDLVGIVRSELGRYVPRGGEEVTMVTRGVIPGEGETGTSLVEVHVSS